ncbi:MAG: dienelactone hydrolase family protein [bacterium]
MMNHSLAIMGWLSLLLIGVSPGARAKEEGRQGEMVTFASGSETIQGYLARPAGDGPHPAILLIHEWWGLNDWMKGNADRFAQQGYTALAVDLYRGAVAQDRDVAHELSRGLPEDRAARDLQGAFAYLQSRPDVRKDKIGVSGWCMGGGYALQAALKISGLKACVICYGRLVLDANTLKPIPCPLLGIFGGQDRGIPPEMVHQFEAACKTAGKEVTAHIYEKSGHAFMNPNNASGYNAGDARDAWAQIDAFFEQTLKK